MAKDIVLYGRILFAALCLYMLPGGCDVRLLRARPFSDQRRKTFRDSLQGIYTAELGVREASGRNDGKRVGQYLSYCKLPQGYNWCAAFVSWCYGRAGHLLPRNPWAPALLPASGTIYTKGKAVQQQPQRGDVFGIWFANLRRIGHVGFVDCWEQKYVLTVEGNSNNAVERRRRPVSTIYRVADWATGH